MTSESEDLLGRYSKAVFQFAGIDDEASVERERQALARFRSALSGGGMLRIRMPVDYHDSEPTSVTNARD